MNQKIHSEHWVTGGGNPAGGWTHGLGIGISWQNGPLGPVDVHGHQTHPNGAFVEGVIAAAIDRIEWYQSGKFACAENEEAIEKMRQALDALGKRTKRRTKEGTEGTHEGS